MAAPPFQVVAFEAAAQRAQDRARLPKGLSGLLRWFLTGWSEETPDTLHRGGHSTWFGPESSEFKGAKVAAFTGPDREPVPSAELVGGSVLGSPAFNESFRRYIEESAFARVRGKVDGKEQASAQFERPMRVAVSQMAWGDPGRRAGLPLAAQYAFALGMSNGDWRQLARHRERPLEDEAIYCAGVLRELWYIWRDL